MCFIKGTNNELNINLFILMFTKFFWMKNFNTFELIKDNFMGTKNICLD